MHFFFKKHKIFKNFVLSFTIFTQIAVPLHSVYKISSALGLAIWADSVIASNGYGDMTQQPITNLSNNPNYQTGQSFGAQSLINIGSNPGLYQSDYNNLGKLENLNVVDQDGDPVSLPNQDGIAPEETFSGGTPNNSPGLPVYGSEDAVKNYIDNNGAVLQNKDDCGVNSPEKGCQGEVYRLMMGNHSKPKPSMYNDKLVRGSSDFLGDVHAEGMPGNCSMTAPNEESNHTCITESRVTAYACEWARDWSAGFVDIMGVPSGKGLTPNAIPVSFFQPCARAEKCIMASFGLGADNSRGGWYASWWDDYKVSIHRPSAVSSVQLSHGHYDDYLEILVNGDVKYQGPDWSYFRGGVNYFPSTIYPHASSCNENGYCWSSERRGAYRPLAAHEKDITNYFDLTSDVPTEAILSFHNVVGGGGEYGFYSKFYFDETKIVVADEVTPNPDDMNITCNQLREDYESGVCQGYWQCSEGTTANADGWYQADNLWIHEDWFPNKIADSLSPLCKKGKLVITGCNYQTNPAAVEAFNAHPKCEDSLADRSSCTLVKSECIPGLTSIYNGTCEASVDEYVCGGTSEVSCSNHGENPFYECGTQVQTLEHTIPQYIPDERTCERQVAPVTGSCEYEPDFVKGTSVLATALPDGWADGAYIVEPAAGPNNRYTQVNLQDTGDTVNVTNGTGSKSCYDYTANQNLCNVTYTCLDSTDNCDDGSVCFGDIVGIGNLNPAWASQAGGTCSKVKAEYNCHPSNQTHYLELDQSASYSYFNCGGAPNCGNSSAPVAGYTMTPDGGAFDNCQDLRDNPICTETSQVCMDNVRDVNGECYNYDVSFDCSTNPDLTVTETVEVDSCSGSQLEKSEKFGQASQFFSQLDSIAGQADCGGVSDYTQCQLFKGKSSKCKIALFGLKSCCNSPDLPPGTLSNLISGYMLMGKVDSAIKSLPADNTVYKLYDNYVSSPISDAVDGGTSYITDSPVGEFASQAYDTIATPINDVFTGFFGEPSEQARMLAEQGADFSGGLIEGMQNQFMETAANFVGDVFGAEAKNSLFAFDGASWTLNSANPMVAAFQYVYYVYVVYQVIMFLIEIFYACDDDEMALTVKKELKSCHYLGKYCSNDTWFGCLEHKKSYCCYASPLPRIMAQQIKKQGIGSWGSAEAPNCGGVTVAQMDMVDWDLVNLSEWLAILEETNLMFGNGSTSQMTFDNMTDSYQMDSFQGIGAGTDRKNIVERTQENFEGLNIDGTRNVIGKGVYQGY